MANTRRNPRNLVNQVAVNEDQAKRDAAAAAQAAIDAVVLGCMKNYIAATAAHSEAQAAMEKAEGEYSNAKIATMVELARASHAGNWTDAQVSSALDAAMKLWAGNERDLASLTARRLRSEFQLAMLPSVRGQAVTVISASESAWREEETARAADPKAPMPLHDKFWNRPAELQLFNLRKLKPVMETRGRGADKKTEKKAGTGVALLTRADMVAAAVPTLSALDQAAADVNRVLAAILKLGTDYNCQETVQPMHDALKAAATAAVLVARLNAGAAPAPTPAPAAPAPAPAPVVAPDPMPGASNIAIDYDQLALAMKRLETK